MMHSIDIIINTFIVLFSIQIWTMIGYGILSCLEEYETTDSELLSCFLWPVIILSWINIKINDFMDKNYND